MRDSPPLGCRNVEYYWTHALISDPPTMQSSSKGVWWCATLSVLFKSDRRVYYTLTSSVVCTFLMFYLWYVIGFDLSWPKRVHIGILYSMDDGFGRWWGLNWSITYNAPDRITHAPFLAYFDYQAEMMQYIQMKRYAGNPRTRIDNLDTNE
jgi:hypothetical protein